MSSTSRITDPAPDCDPAVGHLTLSPASPEDAPQVNGDGLPSTEHLDIDDAKDHYRRIIRQRRSEQHTHAHHTEACEHLAEHIVQAVGQCDSVAAYVSVAHEPCTRLALERLEQAGVKILLPVLGPKLSRSWGYFRGLDDLAERAPGRPPEPGGEVLGPEEIGNVDAVLVPALAIDRRGQRLGQGGGWYDRMLPLRRSGAQVFAVVHDDELVTRPLPVADHDECVDAVITPHQWFLLEGSVFRSGR